MYAIRSYYAGFCKPLKCRDELVFAGFKSQSLGCEYTDIFTVHCFVDRFGIRNNMVASCFCFKECSDTDGFYLWKSYNFA